MVIKMLLGIHLPNVSNRTIFGWRFLLLYDGSVIFAGKLLDLLKGLLSGLVMLIKIPGTAKAARSAASSQLDSPEQKYHAISVPQSQPMRPGLLL